MASSPSKHTPPSRECSDQTVKPVFLVEPKLGAGSSPNSKIDQDCASDFAVFDKKSAPICCWKTDCRNNPVNSTSTTCESDKSGCCDGVAGKKIEEGCRNENDNDNVTVINCQDGCCSGEAKPPKLAVSTDTVKKSITVCAASTGDSKKRWKSSEMPVRNDKCCSLKGSGNEPRVCKPEQDASGSEAAFDESESIAAKRGLISSSKVDLRPDNICCGQKRKPCCDSECLERLARRECEKSCGGVECATNTGNLTASSMNNKRPCSTHIRSTKERYSAVLAAFGCLCRKLILDGQQSCCVAEPRRSIESQEQHKKNSQFTDSEASYCSHDSLPTNNKCKKQRRERFCGENLALGEIEKKSLASENEIRTIQKSTQSIGQTARTSDKIDAEIGLSGLENHIILSISGMTCTGCETKLNRTFAHMKHLKNVKTSLILSRAEFDIDLGGGTVQMVIDQLVRATGFVIEQISTNKGSEIDLIPQSDIRLFMKQELPVGVNELSQLDKRTVRVQYDPKILPARSLFGSGIFKCPIQLAPLRPDPAISASRRHVFNMGLLTLLSTVLTIPVLVMAWAPISHRPILYGSVSLALATIVQFVVAGHFYPTALKSLIFSGVIEMDLLIVLSTTAAYIFSVVAFGYLAAGQPLSTGEFFETSTLLVTLIMVGRLLTALARQKAVESISIRSLQSREVLVRDESGRDYTEIDARLLQFGDVFKVMPDCRIPTDGTVIEGSSEVNESMITGEPIPVIKTVGASVISGTVNGSSMLVVRLTRLPDDNTITTIAAMVDEAKLTKPRLQETADRVASYFVPVIIVVSMITFAIWVGIGLKIRNYSSSEAVINAITYAITVLIVSCPCAVGLAVPMVVVIMAGVASEHGIIFKDALTLETARKVTHVVFDKTGTLTEGKLTVSVEKYVSAMHDQDAASAILAGLVTNVKHPVAIAIATMLKDREVTPAEVVDIKTIPGKGIEGTYNGQQLRAGNAYWLDQESHLAVQATLSQGYTVFCLVIDSSLSIILGLSDSIRQSASPAISSLQARDIQISIVSGDDSGPVRSTAKELGISEYRARCSPADKQKYLHNIVEGNPKAVTLFLGDGTNDAVALSQATIGVHMTEGGTDVAASAADAMLMRPDLNGILRIIQLSQAAVRRIALNFAWSFIYNLLAVLLASGALVNVRIPPQYGGLGELVSVLPVIAIALQLKWAASTKR